MGIILHLLLRPLSDTDSYIYHYTPIETALQRILPAGLLMLNSFSLMNEPQESKGWEIQTRFVESSLWPERDWVDFSARVSQTLNHNAKVLCFSRDREGAVGQWYPGGLLSRGYVRPTLWHRCANSYHGVCLMFSVEKLHRALEEQLDTSRLFANSVDYQDERLYPDLVHSPFSVAVPCDATLETVLPAIEMRYRSWIQELYFTKLTDWSVENEYRFVYLDDNAEPLPIRFHDALETVIVGEGIGEQERELLTSYCVQHCVDMADLKWCDGIPLLDRPLRPYLTPERSGT